MGEVDSVENSFLKPFFVTCVVVFFFIVAINVTTNEKLRVFLPKDLQSNHTHAPLILEGHDKTNLIKSSHANCIIVGSSRTELGINPEHIKAKNCINVSMIHASMHDILKVVEYSSHYLSLDYIIFGLDFAMFTNDDSTQAYQNPTPNSAITAADIYSLFTYQSLKSSFLAYLDESEPDFKSHLSNGQRKRDKWTNSFLRNGHYRMFNQNEIVFFSKNIYLRNNDSKFTDKYQSSLRDYKWLIDLAIKNNIKLYSFISPTHIRQLHVVKTAGRLNEFMQWKTDVLTLLGGKYPLWDFSYMESITDEPVPVVADSKRKMRWYWESQHYKEVLGDILLKELLNNNNYYKADNYKIDASNMALNKQLDELVKKNKQLVREHNRWVNIKNVVQ